VEGEGEGGGSFNLEIETWLMGPVPTYRFNQLQQKIYDDREGGKRVCGGEGGAGGTLIANRTQVLGPSPDVHSRSTDIKTEEISYSRQQTADSRQHGGGGERNSADEKSRRQQRVRKPKTECSEDRANIKIMHSSNRAMDSRVRDGNM
jgi:hypothetical protein